MDQKNRIRYVKVRLLLSKFLLYSNYGGIGFPGDKTGKPHETTRKTISSRCGLIVMWHLGRPARKYSVVK